MIKYKVVRRTPKGELVSVVATTAEGCVGIVYTPQVWVSALAGGLFVFGDLDEAKRFAIIEGSSKAAVVTTEVWEVQVKTEDRLNGFPRFSYDFETAKVLGCWRKLRESDLGDDFPFTTEFYKEVKLLNKIYPSA